MTKSRRPQPQVETELTSVSSASGYASASELIAGSEKESSSADQTPPNAEKSCSRRTFLRAGLSLAAAAASQPLFAQTGSERADNADPIAVVDLRRLVSRAELTYTKPVSRSEEGMPIGNGRMGTLVWTTPSALKFQINRPDVFAENCETHSFPERHTDYGSGCGYVDIDFVDFGDDVFAEPAFRQNLSLYDALMTVRGNGITARVLAWHERDIIAIEIDDQRKQHAAI